ncbi:hypothetical protein CDZ96_24915 [Mameliella alba]|nr:hypothetical protein CDZ96_24915 [Mameliella alba]
MNKHVLQAVLDGKADLGFAYNLPPTPTIEVMPRMNAQLGTVVSTAHPIAHMNMVPLSECLTYPLIFADKSMPIRQIVAEAFDASGQDVNPAFETNSIEAMKSNATGSGGIAFLSRFDILEERREGKLTYIPIRDGAFGSNTLSLVRRQKRAHGLASSMFTEEMRRALGASID